MLRHLVFVSVLVVNVIFESDSKITGYDLVTPDKVLILPDTLREISGVTIIDSVTFACIQDENGILFVYDIQKNKIKKQYKFSIDGDYEGIAKVKDNMYVLRSDGVLFEIINYASRNFKLNTFKTGIPSINNEGLCYDEDNNRLLVACKGKIEKGAVYKDKRAIYGFDLKLKKLSSLPVFNIDVNEMKDFSVKNGIKLPLKTRKEKGVVVTEPFVKFRTSAICIHPFTKQLFLLSAADHMLFVFNKNGAVEHVEQLNPSLFNKAEGIAFQENGNMLITNEGQSKKPTVLYFKYRKTE